MWQYFCNIKNISLGPTMSMKINSQKKSIFPMKNFLDNSFSYCRVCQTSGKFMIGSTRYYSNQCTSYKIDSVTPKILLKTQCKKKVIFPAKKKFRPIFPRIIEYEKLLWNILSGSTRYWITYWTSYKIISLGPTRSMKKCLKKRLFSRRKSILTSFYWCYRVWETSSSILLKKFRNT